VIHVKPANLAVPVNHADHVLGPETAKVTVVEYGDFECPNCAQAYPAVKILTKHFGERMRFVFRHFPLREVHPHAELAAEAAETAGAQRKFWLMHDLLFENQSHLKEKNLRRYAEQAELDLERYDYELKDHVYLQRIQEHIEGGIRSSVRSTPTFFVNGVLQEVSFGLEHLRQAIEMEI
jgi:protein-disulfide isomerase